MKFDLNDVVVKINNVVQYNSGQYHRESKKGSQVPFKKTLKSKLNGEIDDKFYYDKFNLKDKGIKFESDEFTEYKNSYKNNYFPPLEAPIEVKGAWKHVVESCPHENLVDLHNLTLFLWDTIYDKNINIKRDEISGYTTLCTLVINRFNNILGLKYDHSLESALKLLTKFKHYLNNNKKNVVIDEYI